MQQNITWQLYNIESQGWKYLYSEQIALAKQTFETGLELAKKHQIACMVLQFEHQLTQVDVYYTFNQEAALDRAVRLLTTSKRPEYLGCTANQRMIYDILLHAYFYRDCLGYEQEIRDSIVFMQKEFQDPYEGSLRCEFILCELDYENAKYAAGRDRAMAYIARAQYAHRYRRSDGYRVASRLMYALGELESARKYAEMNVEASLQGSYQSGVACALLWQAVFSKYLGNEDAARIFERAHQHIEEYKIMQTHDHFDAIALYYELAGDAETAIATCELEFESLAAEGSLHDIALAHLQYCRLLGRLQKPIDSAIAQAREFIATLRKPKVHEQALQGIEAGDFHQFAWQKHRILGN